MKTTPTLASVLTATILAGAPAFADGFKDCTKIDKASWKPASEAEAKAVRRQRP